MKPSAPLFAVLLLLAALVLSALGMPAPAAAQSTEAPTVSAEVVQSAEDYFVDAFADPVDYANPEDQLLVPAATQNTSARIESGELRWERRETMNVAPVWAGYAPSAFAVGREGIAVPVDTVRFTQASFRMYSAGRSVGTVGWDRCGPDLGRCPGSVGFTVESGWQTYQVALHADSGEPWEGQAVEVRITVAGDGNPVPMALDWFRLHGDADPVLVTYGGGTLYWDGDADRANNTAGNPGWGVVAAGGGTAEFPAAAYPDGTYRFHADDGPSSAPVTIGGPVPELLDPDAAGGVDYAATVRGNAWDFNGSDDVTVIGNAADVRYEGGVLSAVNAGAPGDPYLYLGLGAPIDTTRFHRLTVRTALEGAFDLGLGPGGGSHGRVLWELERDPPPRRLYDSKELVIYPGVVSYTVDLADDASDTGVDARPGWTEVIPGLRYDPNEDPGTRRWSLDEIALRADDQTVEDMFEVRWREAGGRPPEGASVSLYADIDRSGFDGALIASGLEQAAGENRHRWDAREFPAGSYHLYAVGERDGVRGRRYAGGPVVVDARIAGADRIGTAVRLSRAAFAGTAPAAVVAAARDFPDALAAAPLADAVGGPVLLNGADGLAPEVAAELDRLQAETVYLMGGQTAQSAAVEAALAARGTVVRVAGANRYGTAAEGARLVRSLRGDPADVLVASGLDFPDALAAAPLAAAADASLLLTDPNSVPSDTAAVLAEHGGDVTVLGGAAAVSEATAAALGADRRLGGANRHATATLLAEEAVTRGADGGDVLVAASRRFPDALAAGPAAGARGGVLLLSERDGLPPESATFLAARAASLSWLRVAGGPAALTDHAVRTVTTAAGR